jgi:phospholipid-binding lipoprotein MlaA
MKACSVPRPICQTPAKLVVWLGLFLTILWVSGCATGPQANPQDPLEPLNRQVYEFNEAVDTALLKPLATTYRDVAPQLLQRGVRNFFDNIQDAWSFANNALQLKGSAAVDSIARFGVNTLLGLGGLIDVASEMNIERRTRDFGHTLGFWGVTSGPYVVLPLLGPSTLRDAVARTVDLKGDIVSNIKDVPTRNSLTAIGALDQRTKLLSSSTMLEEAALDKYTFTRDAYLQHRESAISE